MLVDVRGSNDDSLFATVFMLTPILIVVMMMEDDSLLPASSLLSHVDDDDDDDGFILRTARCSSTCPRVTTNDRDIDSCCPRGYHCALLCWLTSDQSMMVVACSVFITLLMLVDDDDGGW
jgi:hypothetical protein